ncbi:reverse transcriptase domain-containing protein [Tanacetum coccineum]
MAPKRTDTTTTTSVTDAQLKALIDQDVADALAERDADRSRNGDDNHDSGTGVRRQAPVAREYTYSDFLKCQPLNFKGTEGVVGLTQWFKKIESVFHISNCTVACQIKFATCTDVVSYNQRFQELALMCDRMFPEESDEIEKYVGGFPDMIHASVMASKPMTMQEAIEFATELMDKKISTLAERVAIAYTDGSGERKEYAGTLPLCNKCKFHHNGQCTVKCANCKRVGHLSRDCRSPAATNNQRNFTCYECENQGHYRSDCPELKNQNHGNQARGTGAHGMMHALGGGETNQDLNNMEDDINQRRSQ